MAYAGKCDRCGGFYDLPFEHRAPIRARMVDVFDDPVETKDLCPDCLEELRDFLDGAQLNVPLEVNQKQLDEMVLRDEFDFGQKRLERFCERFNLKTDALCDEEIIWDDLIQTLKEETGLDFTIRENK
nr:MAG TPA: F420H2 dehydrogenase subunit [Caudoviricetes sp.]